MNLYLSQIEDAEKRYIHNEPQRKRRKEGLKNGDWSRIDSADRIRMRAASIGMSDLVERAVTGGSRARSDKAVVLEAIINDSQLSAISVLYKLAAASRAVARLEIKTPFGGIVHHGSGFLISPRLLMTNHHVLPNAQLAIASLAQFDYYQKTDLSVTAPVIFELDSERFFLSDEHLDYTIVGIREHGSGGLSTVGFGYIRLIAASGKAIVGERVNIIQHPAGRPKEVSFRENLIVDRVGDFLQYKTDTQKGASGSPVLDDKNCELAALHHAGVPVRNDQGEIMLRDGRIWDGSKADEDKLAYRANEGTRISSIVAHVRTQPLDDEHAAIFEEAFQPPPAPEKVLAGMVPGAGFADAFSERTNAPVSPLSDGSAKAFSGSPRLEADGTVSWMLRVNVGLALQSPADKSLLSALGGGTVSFGRSHPGHSAPTRTSPESVQPSNGRETPRRDDYTQTGSEQGEEDASNRRLHSDAESSNR